MKNGLSYNYKKGIKGDAKPAWPDRWNSEQSVHAKFIMVKYGWKTVAYSKHSTC